MTGRMTALILSALVAAASAGVPIHDLDREFEKFLSAFGKLYDGVEKEVRKDIFKANYRYIMEENSKGHSYTLGINEFADMEASEFAVTHLGLKRPENVWGSLPSLGWHQRGNATLAASVDWRTKGAVTEVKNQAQCGSCWAFSTTGSLEGAWQIATKHLVSLSEQQFVDCARKFGEMGCSGGMMDSAFQFAEQTALCTEASYPYKARDGACQDSKCAVGIPQGGVKGFKDVKVDDSAALMDAVSLGPVSVAIEADLPVFQLYKSGVMSGTCGNKLDHGVLVAGYGTTSAGQDYWIVKNSWGASWGVDGYAMLLRGKGGDGECGILKQASYPVVSGSPGPSPGPSPPPAPPAPPAPSSPHYEKPPCRSDEAEASVQGAGGELCAPKCDASGSCPTDVPEGTKAKPQCILQDAASGDKYCALQCMLPFSCPSGAKCARVAGFMGVCVYPQTKTSHIQKTLEMVRQNTEITV